ncbi:unnamed protein product [Fraxinus pennsylvanica]|uniref:F-box domain-containing protein n=1 Tax=Fraxinus pennsylvanica TaxID=56036 RepID=A0AAD2DTH7_9LAMI|nr:unnamed protein product [Fraxinus pennsylvanica]
MRDKKFLMNLPSEIIVEIFSRLPAVTVMNCKIVCKKSRCLLSTPEFAKLHLSRSTLCLVSFHYDLHGRRELCRLFEFNDEIDHHDVYYNPVIKFEPSVLHDVSGPPTLVGSVNGFVCFRNFDLIKDQLYVCNPITREYVILPVLEWSAVYSTPVASGFGVSTISDQYKVVKFLHKHEFYTTIGARSKITKSECSVYTIGTDSWRNIGGVPIACEYVYSDVGTFFNGSLHWMIKELEGSKLISCFNLEEESFQSFPTPFHVEENKKTSYDLGVISGCLCLSDNNSDFDFVIWVMKDYGVEKSWAKPQLEHVRALNIFKDGDILLEGKYLFSYSTQRKSVRKVDIIDRTYYFIRSMLHISSFLSLKDLYSRM